ncbi:zinc-binding alcohol dehydrogenase family protein [Rubritalea marina]|uniref:zinc-binding alcohol dehydrogenase family protein n=1 Tax=Rubritalea marina TaxID=361055 RepID=UPI00036FC166|nr:zinc-binding alcohol dehydrogenase family protein [Rubritalea marina]
MKSFAYQSAFSLDSGQTLQELDLPQPVAQGHDLLVEVKAISVNPVDAKVRQWMSAEPGKAKVLGWDAAGVVKAVGDKVSDFKVGDEVWYAGDLTRPGSNAEFQLVDARIVGRKPSSLGFAEAAAMPLTTITAWEMLFDRLEVEREHSDKTILVIGAAGGVGSIMVQLLKHFTALKVIGTASRAETVAWLKELGVDYLVNHRQPVAEQVRAHGIKEVDYVVSLTNTEDHYENIVDILKPQGKLGLIDDPKELDVVALKQKCISLHWEFMFTRSMFHTDDINAQHELLNQVAELVDQGKIKSTLGEHFGEINVDNLMRAHALLESQAAKGKIVLEGF